MTGVEREPPFFGRGDEMKHLRERVARPGLTVLTGRPQIGKSRLLQELLAALRQEKTHLVGYHRASATESALLYAAADLYEHALPDARWRDQLKILHRERGAGLPARVGKAVGDVLAEATPGPVKAAFQKTFGALTAADDGLRTGGGRTVLQPVAIDEVRTLLDLADLAGQGRPPLLIVDQWEDGQDPDHEATLLRTYLQEMARWPEQLHIILHLRHPADDQTHAAAVQAWNHVRDFEKSSAAVEVHDLPPIDFEKEEAARGEMLKWLHGLFPFLAESMSDGELIDTIHGNPAVLQRWLDRRPEDAGELREVARAAHVYHYVEIENTLRQLRDKWDPGDGDAAPLDVALRLILLSPMLHERTWPVLQPSVLQGAPDSVLDYLCAVEGGGLIERSGDVPSLGHPTRREAAIHLATTDETLRPHTRRALERLVERLAEEFTSVEDETSVVVGLVLAALEPQAGGLGAGGLPTALMAAATTLLGRKLTATGIDHLVSSVGTDTPELAEGARRLLAASLVNTLIHAKEEGDPDRRDALLDELRALRRDHPDDTAVREQLAKGLFNTLNHAKEEGDLPRRDALLDELRALRRDHADDAAVREQLAGGLFNTLYDTKEEGDLPRRDALLDELRALRRDHADDAAVREGLAKGLFNTLNQAKEEKDLPRRDALLDELRALRRDHPDDTAVRERLAMGLVNTLNDAKEEKDLPRRDALLDELRTLQQDHPDDTAVREQLAMGLLNTLIHAKEEGDLPRRKALLDELRALRRDHPDDMAVREKLAAGLVNALNDAKEEGDLSGRDALLDELRALRRDHADDAAVLGFLMFGLHLVAAWELEQGREDNAASAVEELLSLLPTAKQIAQRDPHPLLVGALKIVDPDGPDEG